ncbi:GNAT family N-acetyltransferase [Anaerosphaera multitolerans]|uniref:GNAT family N-acetyltransferase n=1 Tax=Anaerosphaera multitolerans TaxID=2487351 RepID=A0A437S657_9FIRM|nr:GNAT family N-acetyltransferase [Anaerosphaera multitolerans]RVU54523.1 GNAT family N-acetyltransferase [Anaerosphaera multitolerans]
MIRNFENMDIERVMEIWLQTNIKAHNFIEENYWVGNYDLVRYLMLQAEIMVYDDGEIKGFIGLKDSYIEGIFVDFNYQNNGIGKKLLNEVKDKNNILNLSVYAKNKRVVNFYMGEGFKIVGENIDKSTGELEYLMRYLK